MSDSPILSLRSKIPTKRIKNEQHFLDETARYRETAKASIWKKQVDNKTTVEELCLIHPCRNYDPPEVLGPREKANMTLTLKSLEATMGKDAINNNVTKTAKPAEAHRSASEKDVTSTRSRFGMFFKSSSSRKSSSKGSRSRSRSKVTTLSTGRRVGKRLQNGSTIVEKKDVGINRQDTLLRKAHDQLNCNVKRTVSEPCRPSGEGRDRIFSFHNVANNNHTERQHEWQHKLANWAASLEEAISVIQREKDLKDHISYIIKENKSLHTKFESMNLECDRWKNRYLQADRELKMRDAITSRCAKCNSMHHLNNIVHENIDEDPDPNSDVMLRSWSGPTPFGASRRPIHTSYSMHNALMTSSMLDYQKPKINDNHKFMRLDETKVSNSKLAWKKSQEDVLASIRGLEKQLGQINARLVLDKNKNVDCCNIGCV